jgi:hypothetical protein
MTTPEDRDLWERDEAELRRQAEDAAITASLERSDAHFRAVLADAPAEQRAERHHHSRKAMECVHTGSDCCVECCEPGGAFDAAEGDGRG